MPSDLKEDLMLALSRPLFAEKLGLHPDPWQRRLLCSKSPRIIINAARQTGKSTVTAVFTLHKALYSPGSLILILAPSERQSKELFAKVADFYQDLGHTVTADSRRKLGMEFASGSRVEALPAAEKTIRGYSGVSLVILDEASRINDELYFGIRPMLSVSGGSLIMLSTPYGRRGIFFETWQNGEGWAKYKVKATECWRIPPSFLEEERSTLPPRVYRQEYECSFEETEDSVFSTELINDAITDEVEPLWQDFEEDI